MRNHRGRHGGRRQAAFLRHLTAQGERVAERVQELGRAALTRAERTLNRLGDKGRRAKKRVRTYITDNPVTSLLIAMGLGAVVGYVLHRPRGD